MYKNQSQFCKTLNTYILFSIYILYTIQIINSILAMLHLQFVIFFIYYQYIELMCWFYCDIVNTNVINGYYIIEIFIIVIDYRI